MVVESLKIEACTVCYGCGIYEVGTEGLRMFITDGGRVLAVEGRAITADDLITAFVWGRTEQQEMSRNSWLGHSCACTDHAHGEHAGQQCLCCDTNLVESPETESSSETE